MTSDDASVPEQPITEPAPADDSAPAEIVPDAPRLIVERFVRTVKDRSAATCFVHVEKLRGSVRRLTLEEWQTEYDAFLKAPRG